MTRGSAHGLTTQPAPAWHKDAACSRPEYVGQADLWFANSSNTTAVTEAKRICHHECPVREACLRAEMQAEGDAAARRRHGVRGGLTGVERRRLYEELQRRAKAAA